MTETSQLLRDYTQGGSESAFRELVRRYIDLVYSVATRRMGGDAHLAEDVTQTVFADLARKAASLPPGVMLGGWLHRHACFVAANMSRSERRRQSRERQAVEMNALQSSPDNVWQQLSPFLDEAVEQLDAADREAVLLRFFEQRDLRSVGLVFGVSEDAAQKRVSRAVERLREIFTQRGVGLSAAVLATALASSAVTAAPAGLAASVGSAALAGIAATTGAALGIWKFFGSMAFKAALAVVVAAAIAVPFILHRAKKGDATQLSPIVTASLKTGATQSAQPKPQGDFSSPTKSATNPAPQESGQITLTLLSAETGEPIASVPIECRRWDKDKFVKSKSNSAYRSNREGVCEIGFSAENTTELELTTRMDGYADTRLHWKSGRGEPIPPDYTLRLTRPAKIGGKVVDADGNSIAGAKVGFNHEDMLGQIGVVESHEFGWIEVETDGGGNWSINRIAPEMIRRIYGGAKHPEHTGAQSAYPNPSSEDEKKLLAGTYVFQLGRALRIQGVVVDADDQPVAGAKILVGERGESSRRETTTLADGSFSVDGCKPGQNLLTAEAKGFAATTVEVNLSEAAGLFRLKLKRGAVLRLKLVDQSGQPIPKAFVWLNTTDGRMNDGKTIAPPPAQVDFRPRTDSEGRVAWSNAPPDTALIFNFHAKGYLRVDDVAIPADGEEHVVIMPGALTVSGTVVDADTGRPVPRFRMNIGWPKWTLMDGTTNAMWSSIGRFRMDFTGGTFSHAMEEAVVGGTENEGYILKFEAEDYAPLVTRVIKPDEGEVRFEIKLHRGISVPVNVLTPAGQPARGADVGLIAPMAELKLVPGGFSRRFGISAGVLLATDLNGQFRLPSDDSIKRLIIAHKEGYLDTTADMLKNNPTVRLQSWGRVEGDCFSAGKPAAGRELMLEYAANSWNTISFDFNAYKITVDKNGHFVFPKVPPGKFKLSRLVVESVGNRKAWMHASIQEVEVRSGETTILSLNTSGRTVTVSLRWPEGFKPDAKMEFSGRISTPLPKPPQDVAAKQWRQSPEFQDAANSAKQYPLVRSDENTVTADEVPPGDYRASITAIFMPGKNGETPREAVQGNLSITVPSDPPTGVFDAGVIQLQNITTTGHR